MGDTGITDLKNTHIYIGVLGNAKPLISKVLEENMSEIPWVKYSIKETDMRVKTASFTAPTQLDLTNGVYLVKIVSKLHENFTGFVLSDDYTENTDGTYTYQCQDMSRQYQGKFEGIYRGDVTNHRIIKSLLTRNVLPGAAKITDEIKETYKNIWSGLRPLAMYQGKLYSNPIATNMMENKPKMIVKNKSFIEVIREICHANGYVDVYFNEDGTLQLKPLAIKDWQQTGLILSAGETASRQFKFDTTNAITGVEIQSTDNTKIGKVYTAKSVTGLDLEVFFGSNYASVSNPQQTTTSNKATTNATKKSADKKTTTNPDNPYKTKRKYLLIDGDGGETKSFLNKIAEHIRKGGWKVDVDGNIGPGAHSRNKGKVKNGCYMPVYNGLCAGTINEMPKSYYGGVVKKNGSVLCPAWDTRTWQSAKMKQYRKGFTKLSYLKRAWDDNFSPSSFKGISNPAKFMTNKGIKYCVGDSAALIAKQFLAGGWVAYNKK
jgi:hypothetical protein